MQQHQRIGQQRERGETQGPTQDVRRGGIELTPLEQGVGDGHTEDGEEHHDRDQRDERQLGSQAEIGDHRAVITVGGVARQARHDGGQQGDTDDAVRHLQQQPVLLVDERRRRIRQRGDTGGDHIPQL